MKRRRSSDSTVIGVVLPSYRARSHILDVLRAIGPEVSRIYVVDDCCPDNTGAYVRENCHDHRVTVLQTNSNLGVGGAVKLGYSQALDDRMDIVIKIDADGQMDPSKISKFVEPILLGRADYSKGNRFYSLESLQDMPTIRLVGNAALSFMTKISSGYWNLMDPTNGYTAIHSKVLKLLPMQKISNGYFFESDMLFRLNTVRAAVVEIPMNAVYGSERSQLIIIRIFFEFLVKHASRFLKRVFYNYFLRDFNIASLELLFGLPLIIGGSWFGLYHWIINAQLGVTTATGTVMLAVLPMLTGFQLLLSAINYDVSSVPKQAIHELL